MHVVIPATGLGTRFLPLSRIVPKEMLPMGGKPLIHHALEEAERAGFEQAVIVLSPAKTAIREYLELPRLAGLMRRLRVAFLEQSCAGGVGQAVLLAGRRLGVDRFAVLLPEDVVTETGHWTALVGLHRATGAATLCVRPVHPSRTGSFGIIACNKMQGYFRVRTVVEKPDPTSAPSNLAILGRYLVTDTVMAGLGRLAADARGQGEHPLSNAFHLAAGVSPGVLAVRFEGEIFDAATPHEYARSRSRFERSLQSLSVSAVELSTARN